MDKNILELIRILYHSQSYLTSRYLYSELGISKRSLQYCLTTINSSLKENNVSPIKYVKSKGYYINTIQKEYLKQLYTDKKQIYYSSDERMIRILSFMIFSNTKLIIDELKDYNEVSRNTVIDDLRKLREQLISFDLKITYNTKYGNRLSGDEKNIRRFYIEKVLTYLDSKQISDFVHLITTNAPISYEEVTKEIEIIKYFIQNVEKLLEVKYTDNHITNFYVIFLTILSRIKDKNFISIHSNHVPKYQQVTSEYLLSDTSIPIDEYLYVEEFLLGANKISVVSQQDLPLYSKLDELINTFEKHTHTTFVDKVSLKKDLILHLSSAIHRINYGIQWINPLFSDIKKEYSWIYNATIKSLYVIQDYFIKPISENEISYIAIIFGGHLTREQNSKLLKRQNLLVLCSKGIGTSRIILTQVHSLLGDSVDYLNPMSIREYIDKPFKVDIAVSTIPVAVDAEKSFIVSTIITESQKELIKNAVLPYATNKSKNEVVTNNIINLLDQYIDTRQYPDLRSEILSIVNNADYYDNSIYTNQSLNDLLPLSRIQLTSQKLGWKEALELSIKPLLKQKYVSAEFQDSIIKNIENFGPYIIIGPGLAFPHAGVNEGAYKLGMSLLILRQPIFFMNSDKPVNIILVLSAPDSSSHIFAIEQLTNLITHSNILEKLPLVKNKYEVIYLLQS